MAPGKMAGDGEAHLTRGGIRFDVGDRLGAADVTLAAGTRVRIDARRCIRGRAEDTRDALGASGGGLDCRTGA